METEAGARVESTKYGRHDTVSKRVATRHSSFLFCTKTNPHSMPTRTFVCKSTQTDHSCYATAGLSHVCCFWPTVVLTISQLDNEQPGARLRCG